jgi:hypothetical protein
MPELNGPFFLYAGFVLLYILFLFWYGGRGEPMSDAEVEQRLAAIQAASSGQPQGGDQKPGEVIEELRRLAASDDGNEFYMLNLINFRAKALYPEGSGYGDNPKAADARYTKAFLPYLFKYGGVPLFAGNVTGRFIDKQGDMQWQRTALVRYRSRRDLLKMAEDIAPLDVIIHKWASIEKTQVFPVTPLLNLFSIRILVAALLTGLAVTLRLVLFRAS